MTESGVTTPYPLAWPVGWPRTQATHRKYGAFKSSREGRGLQPLTVALAVSRLQRELDMINARHVVLSSNLELRLDGLPRGGQGDPGDPGVCVYFQLKGRATTLPCDRYQRVADNIAAIAAHIEATRAIERHGVGTLDQMFTGFQAIRGPGSKPWREVLGIAADTRVTAELIRERRVALAKKYHPDSGGSDALMSEVNAAADRAMMDLAGAQV